MPKDHEAFESHHLDHWKEQGYIKADTEPSGKGKEGEPMNTEKAWSELFNSLPLEKRREIIVYGIHDGILMVERSKEEVRNQSKRELERLDASIATLRRYRDRVWDEMIKEWAGMNVKVPEKVLDLLDEIYQLTGIPEDRPKGLGWFTLSFGLPSNGIICAIKFHNSKIISLGRYDGDKSCWEYHTCQWVQIPDMDESIELWHPLPAFDCLEL